jgi:hypothetical protein
MAGIATNVGEMGGGGRGCCSPWSVCRGGTAGRGVGSQVPAGPHPDRRSRSSIHVGGPGRRGSFRLASATDGFVDRFLHLFRGACDPILSHCGLLRLPAAVQPRHALMARTVNWRPGFYAPADRPATRAGNESVGFAPVRPACARFRATPPPPAASRPDGDSPGRRC